MRGTSPSVPEVTDISGHGFGLLLDGRELFLAFEQFPWFRSASVEAILEVERPNRHHLYWPQLDVDLALDAIEHPERYPLEARRNRRPGPGAGTAAPRR